MYEVPDDPFPELNPEVKQQARAALPLELRPPICQRHSRECVRDEEMCCWYCPKCRENRAKGAKLPTMDDLEDWAMQRLAHASRLLAEGKWTARQWLDYQKLVEQWLEQERLKRVPQITEAEMSRRGRMAEINPADHQMAGRRQKAASANTHVKGNWDMRGIKAPTERI